MTFWDGAIAEILAGKRILVTGGTRGIVEAIVNRLRRGGALVLATARTIPADGKAELFIQADATTSAGADQVIQTTLDRLAGLDNLINSLGGSTAPSGGALTLTGTSGNQHDGRATELDELAGQDPARTPQPA